MKIVVCPQKAINSILLPTTSVFHSKYKYLHRCQKEVLFIIGAYTHSLSCKPTTIRNFKTTKRSRTHPPLVYSLFHYRNAHTKRKSNTTTYIVTTIFLKKKTPSGTKSRDSETCHPPPSSNLHPHSLFYLSTPRPVCLTDSNTALVSTHHRQQQLTHTNTNTTTPQ